MGESSKPKLPWEPKFGWETPEYGSQEFIGQGTYGNVYHAKRPMEGDDVALKMIRTDEREQGIPSSAIREMHYLQMLRGQEKVVPLLDAYTSPKGELVMVLEYFEYDLAGFISEYSMRKEPIPLPIVKFLLRNVISSVDLLSTRSIMHRDLKASNILLSRSGAVKLADFGLATVTENKRQFSTNVQTLWYRAPEIFLGNENYTCAIDMWSVGCIFLELLTLSTPFPGEKEAVMIDMIVSMCGLPIYEGVEKLPHYRQFFEAYEQRHGTIRPDKFSRRDHIRSKFSHLPSIAQDEHALDLICGLLDPNPHTRLTPEKARHERYFYVEPMPCLPSELNLRGSMHEMKARKLQSRSKATAAAASSSSVTAGPPPTSLATASTTSSGAARPAMHSRPWTNPSGSGSSSNPAHGVPPSYRSHMHHPSQGPK